MAANTKLASGANSVTFTDEPTFRPDPTEGERISRGSAELTADGQPIGHAHGDTSPILITLRWSYMPKGTSTATGGTEYLGLEKFFHLVGGRGAKVTWTDEDSTAHANAYIWSDRIRKKRGTPNSSFYDLVELDLMVWESPS